MVIKSVLSWVDILCRSLASQGSALQIHAGTRGKKALLSVAWPEHPMNVLERMVSLRLCTCQGIFGYVFGLTNSFAEVSCHMLERAKMPPHARDRF